MSRGVAAYTLLHAAALCRRWLMALLRWIALGLGLFVLLYQVPARHVVEVGYNDAAYVQGFNDPLNRWGVIDENSQSAAPLRWSRAQSFLLFPQIGLPAQATIRWRALRAPGEPQPTVTVLLNGREELGTFATTGGWETHSFPIDSGLLKANDLFLELRTDLLIEENGESRGVQVAAATLATTSWPIMPYPAQLLYGTAAIVFGTALVRNRKRQALMALLIGLAFLLLYRLPITPFSLRSLPPLLALGLGLALVVKLLPRVGRRARSWLLALLATGIMASWLGWLLLTAQSHVALSVPGVERDFPVFASRAAALGCDHALARSSAPCVLRADGFYQLGYPLGLWLVKSWTGGNPFAAGRLIAAASGTALLLATAALAWSVLPRSWRRGGSLLAMLVAALSPLVVQYSLYVGTDMPFAAVWSAGIAALLASQRQSRWLVAVAGGLCGLAFVIRHPGLVLLPFGVLALALLHCAPAQSGSRWQRPAKRLPWPTIAWFVAGWLVLALPQLVVNVLDTGRPLYSQQAKNIWLAVYGNTDYSGRWGGAANTVGLSDIVLADPPRFWGNWGRNLVAFVGTGAENTREFGQALGLRLLHVPANWFAVAGLGLWTWRKQLRGRLLVTGAALYVLGVSVGFVLPRFFLPLAPIWAVAAVAALVALTEQLARAWPQLSSHQWGVLLGMLLVLSMARGPYVGARYVLDHQDPAATPRELVPRGMANPIRLESLGKADALVHSRHAFASWGVQMFTLP